MTTEPVTPLEAFYASHSAAHLVQMLAEKKSLSDTIKRDMKLIEAELAKRLAAEADKAFGADSLGTRRFMLPGSNHIEVKAVREEKVEWDSEALIRNLPLLGKEVVKLKAEVGAAIYKGVVAAGGEKADILTKARTTTPKPTAFTFEDKPTGE